jgi:electron transport complex protein RnfE
MSYKREFLKGFWELNPVFKLVLGMCPTLAVTTAAINGIGMGLATTFVLVCSNMVISLIRNAIPKKVRIPAFIVIIASFVTIIDLVMAGYFYQLHKELGLFIPLIVVNCIILGRAEAFASKNKLVASFFDGLGIGLGFTIALTVLGAVREILGNGTLFGAHILPASYTPMIVFILPPGAFLTLGFLMAIMNKIEKSK